MREDYANWIAIASGAGVDPGVCIRLELGILQCAGPVKRMFHDWFDRETQVP